MKAEERVLETGSCIPLGSKFLRHKTASVLLISLLFSVAVRQGVGGAFIFVLGSIPHAGSMVKRYEYTPHGVFVLR